MKILLTSFGSRGDVYPLIYLGRELKKQGDSVLFLTSSDYKARCLDEGFCFIETANSFRRLLEAMTLNFDRPLKQMIWGIKTFSNEMDSFLRETEHVIENVDLIIASGLQLTAPILSEKYNIPLRYIIHIPVLIPSREYAPFFVPYQNLPKIWNSFLWLLTNLFLRGTVVRQLNSIRKQHKLTIQSNLVDHIGSHNIVLAMPALLGPQGSSSVALRMQINYLADNSDREVSEKTSSFIDRGTPPIYFGFGSMLDGKKDATLALIIETVNRLDERAVISSGWSNYTSSDLPENILIVHDEPHKKLFQKMKLIVHHGGAGTFYSASRAGIPQLTIPQAMDQYYWTKRIKELGIGVGGIRKNKVTVSYLYHMISITLTSNTIRENCSALKSKLMLEHSGYQDLLMDIKRCEKVLENKK